MDLDALFDAGIGVGEGEAAEAAAAGPTHDQERRTRQCRHDGCDSAGEYDVYLHVRYGWHLVAIQSMKSTLRVCNRHRKAANDFLLSDHNKSVVSRELAKIGRLAIDWDKAMVEFVPCGEISWGPQQMIELQTGRA